MTATAASSPAATLEALCNRDLSRATERLQRAYLRSITDCIKFKHYDSCRYYDDLVAKAEGKLDQKVSAAGSSCAAAIAQGTSIAQFGPTACPRSWSSAVPNCTAAYPTIDTLEDLAGCIKCTQTGVFRKVAHDLHLPATAPTSSNESKCIRSAFASLLKATRAGYKQLAACVALGTQPFACELEADPALRFGKALTAIDKKAAKCRSDAGVVGAVSGAVMTMCQRAVVQPSDVAQCMRQMASCVTCGTGNLLYGQGQDCAAFSGDRTCDDALDDRIGAVTPETYFVANGDDGTVTAYAPSNDYSYEGSAIVTLAVGDQPSAIATSPRTDTLFVANAGDDSVTLLDASDATYINGSLAASTFAVGATPSSIAVHEGRLIVYVANRGDGTVTFLDGWDGSYLYDSIVTSTFPVGNDPTALAVDEQDDVLFVTNGTDDTVVMLDAVTGAPRFGSLVASTFPAGDAPAGLAFQPASGELAVANSGDGTVTFLDAATGAPLLGSLASSSVFVGAGARSIVTQSREFYYPHATANPFYVAAEDDDVVAVLDSTALTGGSVVDALASAGAPAALAVTKTGSYRDTYGALRVISRDASTVAVVPAMTPYARLGLAAVGASLVDVGSRPTSIVANEAQDLFFIGTLDGRVLALDALDGSVLGEVPVGTGSVGLTYIASVNVLYAFDSVERNLVLLDGTTGGYLNGTLPASSACADCTVLDASTYNVSASILYVREPDNVVFLNATTGAYLYGTHAASSFGFGSGNCLAVNETTGVVYCGGTDRVDYLDAVTGEYVGGSVTTASVAVQGFPLHMTVSESAGALYVGTLGGSAHDQFVFLDATTPDYLFGSLAASRIVLGTYEAPRVLHDDEASQRVYAVSNERIRALDAATATVVASLDLPLYRAVFALQSDLLFVAEDVAAPIGFGSYVNTIDYLSASSLTPISGTLDASSALIGASATGIAFDVSTARLAVARTEDEFHRNGGVVLLDLTSPTYLHSRRLGDFELPTGAGPSAVAAFD